MTQNNKSAGATIRLVLLIIAVPLLLTGAIFITAGIVFRTMDNKSRERCTETVTAEVIEMVEGSYSSSKSGRHSSGSHVTYAPKFSYTVDGMEHVTLLNSYSYPPEYEVGQKAEIHYDPDDPSVIYVDSDKILRTMSMIFLIVGSATFAAGLVIVIIGIKVGRPPKPADEMAYYEQFG